MTVRGFDLDFPEAEASYNGLGVAADGTIVAALSTKSRDAGARLFAFDPRSERVRVIADLERELGTPGSLAQAKVHVDFAPLGDALLGATHVGFYEMRGGRETPSRAWYAGGCFFTLEGDRVTRVAQAPEGEGIITMSAQGSAAFALTWPGGLFLTLKNGELRNHGPMFGGGETGSGRWMRICRSIGIDDAGHAFWCDGDGRIFRYDGADIAHVGTTPRRELWRKVVWDPARRTFFGVAWASGTLFRFDRERCEEIGTLRRRPATLAFALDGDVLHALAPGVVHVRHDLNTNRTTESQPLRLDDGRWVDQVQSLVIAEGAVWSIGWVGKRFVLITFAAI